MDGAKLQDAQEVKFLETIDVNVRVAWIGMELYAYYVLMVKYGILIAEAAFAPLVQGGMVISVKNSLVVQEVEFITKIMINVYAPKDNFGMVQLVWFSQIVVVDNYGIWQLLNAIALRASIGMDKNALHV